MKILNNTWRITNKPRAGTSGRYFNSCDVLVFILLLEVRVSEIWEHSRTPRNHRAPRQVRYSVDAFQFTSGPTRLTASKYRMFNLKVDRISIWVIYLLRFTTCYITQLTCIYSKCWKWCLFISMHLSTRFTMFLATFLSVLSFETVSWNFSSFSQ